MKFKIKGGMQFSAVFAPLLALLVGVVLYLRPDRLNETDTRLRLVRLGISELIEMEAAGRRTLNSADPILFEAWERQYRAVGRVLETQATDQEVEHSIIDVLNARHAALWTTFKRLEDWSRRPASARDAAQGAYLEEELLRHYRELFTGLLSLIEINQHQLSVAQQNLDTVAILFAALMALILAGFAFAGVRAELSRRGQMTRELEQNNILLSDAFVRLRRAEQGFQQERLQLLRKMMQGVIQEVRAHLQPVIRSGETLLDYSSQLAEGDRIRQALESITASARAAKTTLDRFVQVTEVPSPAMEHRSVDLNRAMEEALRAHQVLIEAAARRGSNLQIDKKLAPLPPIDGSESEWRESLAHLIQNSLEAMPQGGVLTLETFEDGDQRVGFRVSDTGQGMSDAVRRHCCEPFFSTKEQESAGLGLTLMAGTVRRHNGSVEIDSRPGKGTRITVRLPRIQAVEMFSAGPADPLKSTIPPCRILLVDDEPWVREALRELLTADGHTVTVAGQGNEALSLFKTETFDLVITDRAMPGMDGERLAEEIKRIKPRMPVILLTGLGDIIRNAGVTSRHVEVIASKPVTPDQLRKALVDAIRAGAESGRG
jgi:signal transduction histidine kinase/ActR/RegA family two-component response regulator